MEDFLLLADMVKACLKQEPDFSLLAHTTQGLEAIDLVRRLKPDVIILDIGLPDIPVEEVIAPIQQYSPETRIIIYSLRDQLAYVQHMLTKGVWRFVSKTEPVSELVKVIRTTTSGPE